MYRYMYRIKRERKRFVPLEVWFRTFAHVPACRVYTHKVDSQCDCELQINFEIWVLKVKRLKKRRHKIQRIIPGALKAIDPAPPGRMLYYEMSRGRIERVKSSIILFFSKSRNQTERRAQD